MMKLIHITVLPLLLFGCSTINSSYFGRTYPQTEEVTFYSATDPVPLNTYKVMGRGTFEAEPNASYEDLTGKIIQTAKNHGADAVKVAYQQQENKTTFKVKADADNTFYWSPNLFWGDNGCNIGGRFIHTDSYGSGNNFKRRKVTLMVTVAKVYFLKKTK